MRGVAKVSWEGGNNPKCVHEKLQTITEPTGVVLYGQPWRKGDKIIEGQPFVMKRDCVKCLCCGAIGRVKA
jgi:hypothetical protein